MQKITEIAPIEKFKSFVKEANTRCGVKFKCKVFQVNQQGEPSSVKGEIYLKDEKTGEDVPVEMIWSLDGQALLIGQAYDLVQEIPFD